MASLANQTISSSYDGLIKTATDNAVGVSGVQLLEDGSGNSLALSVGRANNGVTITGDLNATLATAAQPNITSVGTLTSLDVGNINMANALPTITMTDTDLTDVYSRIRASLGGLLFEADEANQQADTTIRFEIDGTESMRIDSSGNIGIGEQNPDSILHISEANPTLKVFSGGSTGNSSILSLGKAFNGTSTIEFHNTTSGEPLVAQIQCDSAENIVFETNPDGVLGSNNNFIFQQAGSEAMRIDSSGNVGIGAVPSEILTIQRSSNNNLANFNTSDGVAKLYLGTTNISGGGIVGAAIGDGIIRASQNLLFSAGGATERMRIDSSGNVGINCSPSFPLHINNTTTPQFVIQNTAGGSNAEKMAFEMGAGDVFKIKSLNDNNTTRVDNILALNAINGNVGIGTSSPTAFANATVLAINNTSQGGILELQSNGTSALRLACSASDSALWEPRNLNVLFGTNNTERMRITSGGYLKASNTGSYVGASSSNHELVNSISAQVVASIHSTASTDPYGIDLAYTGASPNAVSNYFLLCRDNAPANRLIIWSNGNVVNTNNSYGAVSDAKLKENVVDASPKLDDLMQVKVRNFNYIGEETKQLGVVAQELEEVFPSMIDESPDLEEQEVTDEDGNVTKQKVDLGTTTKSVKYSVFVPMLIKAMQEQQEIINDLKARIETLENN